MPLQFIQNVMLPSEPSLLYACCIFSNPHMSVNSKEMIEILVYKEVTETHFHVTYILRFEL